MESPPKDYYYYYITCLVPQGSIVKEVVKQIAYYKVTMLDFI